MAVTRFIVTIDRLRLHGVSRDDASAVVAALQSGLEHSFAGETARSSGWASVSLAQLRPDTVHAGGGPHTTGLALGQAMAARLVKAGSAQ